MFDKREFKFLTLLLVIFVFFYFLPLKERIIKGIIEALYLTHEYARAHVIFCLIPAFFIAGAISTFLSQNSVMKYLGPSAPKIFAYGIASISGSILAVCSCTILPLFAGIYYRGAGIGPATTFLYSGPAINILALVLTVKVLGLSLGIARILASILGSIVIGVLMAFIFRKEEKVRFAQWEFSETKEGEISLYKRIVLILSLVGILIFATWSKETETGNILYQLKWYLVIAFAVFLGTISYLWFNVSLRGLLTITFLTVVTQTLFSNKELSFLVATLSFSFLLYKTEGETKKWLFSTYFLIRQILPFLFIGVFLAGFFLGRPNHEGLIPSEYVVKLVGGNSLFANLFVSISGAFMYFATLTEVPILQGFLGAGMGKGPALALLLSGPAVSLPSLLVLNSILGTRKTLVYLFLVVTISSVVGYFYGQFFN